MKILPILAALLLALPASVQAVATPATELPAGALAAGAVVEGFHAALARGDTKAAAALLADDALVYESGGVERGKAEYEAHHLGADAAFARATRRSVTRRMGSADGRTAWIASETTTRGTYKTRTINSVGAETMILRKGPAGWRIVHVHWSSADAR